MQHQEIPLSTHETPRFSYSAGKIAERERYYVDSSCGPRDHDVNSLNTAQKHRYTPYSSKPAAKRSLQPLTRVVDTSRLPLRKSTEGSGVISEKNTPVIAGKNLADRAKLFRQNLIVHQDFKLIGNDDAFSGQDADQSLSPVMRRRSSSSRCEHQTPLWDAAAAEQYSPGPPTLHSTPDRKVERFESTTHQFSNDNSDESDSWSASKRMPESLFENDDVSSDNMQTRSDFNRTDSDTMSDNQNCGETTSTAANILLTLGDHDH